MVPFAYEQDQMAKAARILYINELSVWFSPTIGPQLYRETFFSLYYFCGAVWHALVGGEVFYSMNLLSAVLGSVGIALFSCWARRFFKIPVWITALLLLCMPIVFISSIYGNEAILAFMLFAASVYCTTFTNRRITFAGGAFLSLACFARPDAVLMLPFVCGITILSNQSENQPSLRNLRIFSPCLIWPFLGFCCAASVTWLLLLRRLPQGETSFVMNFSPKIVAAYLVYPFCPGIVMLAVVGWVMLFRQNYKKALLLLLLFVPLIFYIKNLSSPKYILPLAVGYAVSAGILINSLTSWKRYISVIPIVFFLGVSLSPFGIYTGSKGAYWYLPTDDGPLPTGSYLSFYQKVREGFFQERYNTELNNIRVAASHYAGTPNLQGYFNPQSGTLVAIERGDFQHPETLTSANLKGFSGSMNAPYVMISVSYLCTNKMERAAEMKFREWLSEGRVRSPVTTKFPFPPIIEIGPLIPIDTDQELGKRILFALDYSSGVGYLPRSRFVTDYLATSWMVGGPELQSEVLYSDSKFTAFKSHVANGAIYSSVMPFRYYAEKDPRSQIQDTR